MKKQSKREFIAQAFKEANDAATKMFGEPARGERLARFLGCSDIAQKKYDEARRAKH